MQYEGGEYHMAHTGKDKFSPILAPNQEPDLDAIQYPVLASFKLDGIRCIFHKGQILSRSLKQIQNKQLREKFEPIRAYSEKFQCIIDGEIYSPNLTFQEITSFVMTEDLTESKTVKKNGTALTIPDHLNFYCFDIILNDKAQESYSNRVDNYVGVATELHPLNCFVLCSQAVLGSRKAVEDYFGDATEQGYEGLILRAPQGQYKFGRGTLKEGIIYKVKPFVTFDGQITDVVQSTEVREGAEKKINELGRSVTSKKKDDRVLIEKASAFWVLYEGKPLKVVLAMTDPEKEEVWKNRESYIGKFVEYKGMLVGSKDLPRHPIFLRFRKDKDDS